MGAPSWAIYEFVCVACGNKYRGHFNTKFCQRDECWSRRAKRKSLTHNFKQDILERDGFACQICGARRNLCVDHIVAIANGGSNDPKNLQTLCRTCNMKKSYKRDWSHLGKTP